MQAIIYQRYGGPEVLELAEVEPPKVHVDSVLVRIRAAAVNPADLQMREGLADANVPTYFPVIPGWDIAGVVEEAGPGAPEFRPGDEVVGYVRTSVATGTAATPSWWPPTYTPSHRSRPP
ncbi:alcohol dehydrogenase catalytic domain-containing protein [Streptomyces mirabilis]|uniref:alcohol dehydrogenase catalytic domain-containing protein n=1 Tax=Streptomyces mirabilis TaxID=68239 RepID=UPI0028F6C613|nr:alcohol dehydrogenase catalytic domain-containing protein [Streptomyces mirabilis]